MDGNSFRPKWQKVIAGEREMPENWIEGKPCDRPGHTFQGKTIRRKRSGICAACELLHISVNLDRERRKPRGKDTATQEIAQKRKRAMKVKAACEEKALSEESFYFSHLEEV